MIRQIWGVARNDLSVWLRSPAAIAAALLPALGMGGLVAVLTNSVGRQPVALVVQGEGRLASHMARILRADAEAYLVYDMPPKDAEHAIGDQRVAAIIVVPENFDDSVARGTAAVDLYLNNVDIDLADDIRRSVTRSVAEFDAPQLGLTGELDGPAKGLLLPNPYRVAIAERDLRETSVSFFEYQVVPVLVLVVLSAGVLGSGLLTARDFTRRTARVMILSPAGRISLVAGRLLGGVLITLALTIPLMLLGWIMHATIPSISHCLALGALLLAVSWMSAGLGTLVGTALRDERLVTMTGLNAAALLFFLGGGFTTVAFLPPWLERLSSVVPTRYAIEGMRQALFYPDLRDFPKDLTILTACAVLSAIVAAFLLTRSWRRA